MTMLIKLSLSHFIHMPPTFTSLIKPNLSLTSSKSLPPTRFTYLCIKAEDSIIFRNLSRYYKTRCIGQQRENDYDYVIALRSHMLVLCPLAELLKLESRNKRSSLRSDCQTEPDQACVGIVAALYNCISFDHVQGCLI